MGKIELGHSNRKLEKHMQSVSQYQPPSQQVLTSTIFFATLKLHLK